MKHGAFLASMALAGWVISASVYAQNKAPEPEYTLSYNVGVVSDYRYRGISQSRLHPALQGGVDFAHKSGFYLGVWGSSVKWIKDIGGDADVELDLYGGYKGTVGGIAYDVGVLRYQYPSNKLVVSSNTTEIYAAATLGPVTAKYSHSVSNLFGYADSKNSGYLDLGTSFDMGNGYSVAPHVGYQKVAGTGNNVASYTDYSVTLNKDWGNGLILSGTLVSTDADKNVYYTPAGKATGKTGVVVGLKYNF